MQPDPTNTAAGAELAVYLRDRGADHERSDAPIKPLPSQVVQVRSLVEL